MANLHTIASISLETGISKEVLRKWEDRYGFPLPERDASGHRHYSNDQGARLKLIQRLIDLGMRPSQVVPLDEASLKTLLESAPPAVASSATDTAEVIALLGMLRARDRHSLTEKLRQEIHRLGLEKFVLEVMCALNAAVGLAWERGEISIHDEHVYTEVIQNLIRESLSLLHQPEGAPRMLVTTPPGELHTLGLLMVEALSSLSGACCISLGAQTPMEDLPHAIRDYRADILCLCFSAAFPRRRIVPFLKTLRGMLPLAVAIWVGGAGTVGLDRSPRGVRIIPTLGELGGALNTYRQLSRHRLQPTHY